MAGAERFVSGVHVRFARPGEREALEALQWRASLVYEEYRADLLANPDAIELPAAQIRARCVRVVEQDGVVAGFSAVIPKGRGAFELDGLFIEPERWKAGLGRALIADAVRLARRRGARAIDVTANPRAEGFYVKTGFVSRGREGTRFGPGIRMRLSLSR